MMVTVVSLLPVPPVLLVDSAAMLERKRGPSARVRWLPEVDGEYCAAAGHHRFIVVLFM